MITRKITTSWNTSYVNVGSQVTHEIPDLCPNCGVSNNPTVDLISTVWMDGKLTLITINNCHSCDKSHINVEIRNNENESFRSVAVYPGTTLTKLPDNVVNLFPRFEKMYHDAEVAEENGALDLAGIGYRASLEILIKDYLLHQKLADKEKLKKTSLNNVIQEYFKGGLFNVASVVKKLGNDYAHWDKKYDIDISILKKYVDIFIIHIDLELSMYHLPIDVKEKQ